MCRALRHGPSMETVQRARRPTGARLAEGLGLATALVGAVTMAGWALDIESFTRIHPSWPSQKANTALGLILAGGSIVTLCPARPSRRRALAGWTLAGGLAAIAVVTLPAYGLGVDLGADQMLFAEHPSDRDSPAPGRMAAMTAINFLLLAVALALLNRELGAGHRPSEYLAFAGLGTCAIAVLGYAYSTPTSHRFAPFSSMALHTALGLAMAWTGVLAARASHGLTAELTSDAAGAGMARRLLPPAVIASALLGLLSILGVRAGWYGAEFATALFATANIAVFSALVWESGYRLNHADSERLEARRQQALSDRRRQRFFDQCIAGACIADLDGTIVECNAEFLRIMGASRDAVVGSSIQRVLGAPAVGAGGDPARLGEPVRGLDLETKRVDGTPLSLRVDVVGESDPHGHIVELCHYVRDVTEQRRIEDQLRRAQKMEAVGQLAGGVAHDFNNLLGVMLGYTDLLQAELRPDDPATPWVEEIRQAADRAAALTRQLLTFSRHQTPRTRLCALGDAVAAVEGMLRRVIRADIELVVDFQGESGRVRADPGQLEQVVMNLAVNARDAMPRGGTLMIETRRVEIDVDYVQTHPEASTGHHLVLAVSDTGEGMDRSTLSRLFEPFFTTKAPGKGTGIGLATVYGIVKRFGGHVAVYSEVGQGSTFKVYLPVASEAEEDLHRQPPAPGRAAGGSEALLVVEDDEALRRVIRRVLEARGYRVLEAADPRAAIRAFETAPEPVELLITDMVLPTTSGAELARRLGQQRPTLRTLYMSGYTDRAVALHRHFPADGDFIQKPFAMDDLLKRVRGALDRDGGTGRVAETGLSRS